MQCPKCDAENEDNSNTCFSCGADLGLNIPRVVFLNQVSRDRFSSPINLPIATMAFLELRKHKKWVMVCLGIIILFGFIVYFF